MPILHMETDIVRSVGKAMGIAAANLLQEQQNLNRAASVLSSGWQGQSAYQFSDELAIALHRLADAAQAGNHLNQRLQREVTEWEQVAAAFGSSSGSTSDGGSGIIGDGNANQTDSGNSSDSPTVMHPDDVFNEKYMQDMINKPITGENSPRLNELMEQFNSRQPPPNPPDKGMRETLREMAEIRGEPPESFYAQYQEYIRYYEISDDKPHIDLNKHDNYLGTTVSLRYGTVVGDVLGLDPVFGALLNPTGGLVGSGSVSYQAGPNDVMAYHGVFHDAGGYLYNKQGKGPGYDYLQQERIPTHSAVSGQLSGIKFWNSQPGLNNQANILVEVRTQAYLQRDNFIEDVKTTTGNTAIKTSVAISKGVNDVKNVSQTIFGWPS